MNKRAIIFCGATLGTLLAVVLIQTAGLCDSQTDQRTVDSEQGSDISSVESHKVELAKRWRVYKLTDEELRSANVSDNTWLPVCDRETNF